MIFEWKSELGRNYGDALTSTLLEYVYGETSGSMKNSKKEQYYLIGSVIDNTVIKESLALGLKPVFISCGWRGKPLNQKLIDKIWVISVRGPKTQGELSRLGLDVPVSGDAAYHVLPFLEIKKTKNNQSLLIPHILDKKFNFKFSKADLLVSPIVKNKKEILEITSKIASSNFVLGGAMHACIVAHYYGVPFAPYSGGRIDCKPKWEDWMESVGLDSSKLKFCSTVEEGVDWYNGVINSRKN
jgi:hypothetical protein